MLATDPHRAWAAAKDAVRQLPGATVVEETDTYIHAECSSSIFGFVDDLELNLRSSENVIAVRSASRLGYSDFGVNRDRVEALRSLLKNTGIIR